MAHDDRGEVRTEESEGVGWVTLSRPHKRNALTVAMWDAIPAAVASLAARSDVVAICVRGADGNFGAGADFDDVLAATAGRAEAEAYCSSVVRALLAVANASLPTLAAVEGWTGGGAASLMLSCDMRIADPETILCLPFARLGVVPDDFTLARLLSLVGPTIARRLVFTGESVEAFDALKVGLIDGVTAPGGLVESAHAWAHPFRHGSQRARAGVKRGLLEPAARRSVEDLIGPMVESFLSGEVGEAARRFLERQPP